MWVLALCALAIVHGTFIRANSENAYQQKLLKEEELVHKLRADVVKLRDELVENLDRDKRQTGGCQASDLSDESWGSGKFVIL